MKIDASHASWYLNHMKVLAYLGGIDEWDAPKLYAKLKRIESKVHRWMEDECNYPDTNYDTEKQLAKVQKLLPLATGLFINGDPRGYSLKMREADVNALREKGMSIYCDWGGYGILAPEF